MRRPLRDVLDDHPDLVGGANRDEAEAHLETLFLTAQNHANAYSAERLQEIYEVAERAFALGAAFPPPPEPRRESAAGGMIEAAPRLLRRFGGGLLLAASAPLVAETSAILAIACAVGAVLTLAMPNRSREERAALPPPKAPDAKFEGLIEAADRSLNAMTAPRALAAPEEARGRQIPEDVLVFLQEALVGDDKENADLRANAERLLRKAGYRPVREGPDELFEVMVDPDVEGPLLLKPALVHQSDPLKTMPGVIVRRRN
jgi:hypothetical protein